MRLLVAQCMGYALTCGATNPVRRFGVSYLKVVCVPLGNAAVARLLAAS